MVSSFQSIYSLSFRCGLLVKFCLCILILKHPSADALPFNYPYPGAETWISFRGFGFIKSNANFFVPYFVNLASKFILELPKIIYEWNVDSQLNISPLTGNEGDLFQVGSKKRKLFHSLYLWEAKWISLNIWSGWLNTASSALDM